MKSKLSIIYDDKMFSRYMQACACKEEEHIFITDFVLFFIHLQ